MIATLGHLVAFLVAAALPEAWPMAPPPTWADLLPEPARAT